MRSLRTTRRKTDSTTVSANFGVLNIQVPVDFIGMHMHRWPSGSPLAPDPTDLAYGHFRTHDNSSTPVNINWRAINSVQGQYDWSGLDTVINYHEGLGKTIIYTIYGCPTWAATANGKTHTDPYGSLGGADKPADITYLSDFITALMLRYNSGGLHRIKFIEIWNEPNFSLNWNGFFWGSAVDMVWMGNAIYAAAKAIDSSIIILSPGFSGNDPLVPFLTAIDLVSGKHGYEICDAIAIHPYGHSFLGQYNGIDIANTGRQSIAVTRELMLANNAGNKALYITEWGVVGSLPTVSTPLTPFDRLSPSVRRNIIRRTLAIAAILNVKGVSLYSYTNGESGWSGNLITDITGVRAALADVTLHLCGKTIIGAQILSDGSLQFTTTVGTTIF